MDKLGFCLIMCFFLGGVVIVVDCIDCAADASVVSAVNEGIEAAMNIVPIRRPWVMISVNDDEDLHFRKAGDLQCFCFIFNCLHIHCL